jgi:molybdopterin converting factor small subunit
MIVHLPGDLHRYTGGRTRVEAEGSTLRALLADLDRRHPGLAFRVVDEQGRIRPHIKMFVALEEARTLATRIPKGAEVHILAALSGG